MRECYFYMTFIFLTYTYSLSLHFLFTDLRSSKEPIHSLQIPRPILRQSIVSRTLNPTIFIMRNSNMVPQFARNTINSL